MNSRIKTRSIIEDQIFGKPKLLPNKLPTYEEIIKFYLFVQNDLKLDKKPKEFTVTKISAVIAD